MQEQNIGYIVSESEFSQWSFNRIRWPNPNPVFFYLDTELISGVLGHLLPVEGQDGLRVTLDPGHLNLNQDCGSGHFGRFRILFLVFLKIHRDSPLNDL